MNEAHALYCEKVIGSIQDSIGGGILGFSYLLGSPLHLNSFPPLCPTSACAVRSQVLKQFCPGSRKSSKETKDLKVGFTSLKKLLTICKVYSTTNESEWVRAKYTGYFKNKLVCSKG